MDDNEHYESGLPEYLQHDLDEYKKALVNGSNLMDCLWCELYGSINAAEITDGVITPEHADYLRKKYLFGIGKDSKEVELSESVHVNCEFIGQ